MTRLIPTILIAATFFSVATPAFAQAGNMHPGLIDKHVLSGIPSEIHQNVVPANLQDRAEKELTRRLNSLQTLLTKINGLKHLTSDQKTTLSTQVQNEITNLTNLGTKIKADTDPDTMKADVQSIIQDYRVFAVFMPQMQILISADRMGDITDNLSMIITKLQTRISQVPTGTDVTAIQNALTDMQTKLADAKTQELNATNLVLTLTPSGYPANKTSLQNARAMLQTGKQDIEAMVADMKLIRTDLKQLGSTISTQPTESLSPSPTI